MKTYILVVFTAAILSACSYRVEKEAEASEVSESFSRLDFALVQNEVFRPACVTCHSQYDRYEDVKRDLSAILSSVESDRMPKSGGPLSRRLKKVLEDWVAAGAPEIPGVQPADPQPVTLEPNWGSVSRHILGPKCQLCHNPNGQAKFLDLSSREAIWNARNGLFPGAPKLIDFENPEASYLFEVIQDPTGPMPPPASGIAPVTEEELLVLTEWVRRGLPE